MGPQPLLLFVYLVMVVVVVFSEMIMEQPTLNRKMSQMFGIRKPGIVQFLLFYSASRT